MSDYPPSETSKSEIKNDSSTKQEPQQQQEGDKKAIITDKNNPANTRYNNTSDDEEDEEEKESLKFDQKFINDIDIDEQKKSFDIIKSKYSIDLPDVSKKKIHQYLNDDLINDLEGSPNITTVKKNNESSNTDNYVVVIDNNNNLEDNDENEDDLQIQQTFQENLKKFAGDKHEQSLFYGFGDSPDKENKEEEEEEAVMDIQDDDSNFNNYFGEHRKIEDIPVYHPSKKENINKNISNNNNNNLNNSNANNNNLNNTNVSQQTMSTSNSRGSFSNKNNNKFLNLSPKTITTVQTNLSPKPNTGYQPNLSPPFLPVRLSPKVNNNSYTQNLSPKPLNNSNNTPQKNMNPMTQYQNYNIQMNIQNNMNVIPTNINNYQNNQLIINNPLMVKSIKYVPSKKAKDTKKKPFEIREGDWTCMECNNLNFAFRTKCNRCGLSKDASINKCYEVQKNIINQNINNNMNNNIRYNVGQAQQNNMQNVFGNGFNYPQYET